MELAFMECDTCSKKPGSPTLCRGCFHNRLVIELLMRERSAFPQPVEGQQDNYVSEVRGETPVFRCLSCDTEQSASCKICGALLVQKVSQPPVSPQDDSGVVNCECHINKSLCALHGGAQITEQQRQLAESMYDAFDDLGGTGNYIRSMLAALAVARQHIERERDGTWEKAIEHQWPLHKHADAKLFIEYVRTDFSPKAAKERVTVEKVGGGAVVIVKLDGKEMHGFAGYENERDAERYAAGLRREIGEPQ